MPPKNNLGIPIAIVITGVLIAGALYFASRSAAPLDPSAGADGDASKVPPVTAADHILGDPNAPIVVIEYVDLECPFCKTFHATMETIMDEYGPSGKVAWVMRNFPLIQIHPNAPTLAAAAECVAHSAGNTAYWKFLSEIFAIAPSGSFFPLNRLEETAVKAGADGPSLTQCVRDNTYRDRIQKEFNDAIAAGGTGTPHTIIVTKDGQFIPLPGAQPFGTMKSVIDSILAEQGAIQ